MDRSAFLVLHYQNSVAHPRGCWGKNLHPQIAKNDSYENAQSALASARSAEMPIIYVNVAFRPGAPELPNKLYGIVETARSFDDCLIGSWGAQPIDELAPKDGDIQIINYSSDAFQGTELDQVLRARDIRMLYLIGQVIEHMVGTSMKRAANSGYSPVLLADCVGGYSDETREAMLDILSNYGRISDSREFTKELSR